MVGWHPVVALSIHLLFFFQLTKKNLLNVQNLNVFLDPVAQFDGNH